MAFCDPNPLASIAYAACLPHGVEPPFEDSALTSRAAYERLNRAAARAETLVLYRLDQLAGCRDSLDVDQVRLEASVQNLWRLTAVRKTLLSIEAALNAPTPTPDANVKAALAEAGRLLAEVQAETTTGSADVPSAIASAGQPALASLTNPGSPLGPRTSSSASASADQPASSPAHPQPTAATSSTASMGSHDSHPTHSSHHSAPNPKSAIRNPQSLLSIHAVPSCPRLSVSSISRTLDRVNADMANYPEHVSTVADYDFNVTAEEFLRPSRIPASLAASVAEDSDSPLLDDPDLSPSLKSQLSTRNASPCPQAPLSPCPQVAPSPRRPVSQFPSLPVSPSPHLSG